MDAPFKNGAWQEIYAEPLRDDEKKEIRDGFARAFKKLQYQPSSQIFGEVIEDRVTQITFSHFGQLAPAALKLAWDPTKEKRIVMKHELEKQLRAFEVCIAGSTSIDVTRKGIDKAYAIKKIETQLGIKKDELLFIGDMIVPGGNDYAVKACGVECVAVQNVVETKKVIRDMIRA